MIRKYELKPTNLGGSKTIESSSETTNTTVSSIQILNSTFLLTGGKLKIWTVDKLKIVKTSIETTLFLFITCPTGSQCLAADSSPSSTNLYLIDSSNFLSTANSAIPLQDSRGGAGCAGVAGFSSAALAVACNTIGTCFVFSTGSNMLTFHGSVTTPQSAPTSASVISSNSTDRILGLTGSVPIAAHFFIVSALAPFLSLVTRLTQTEHPYLANPLGQLQCIGSPEVLVSRSRAVDLDSNLTIYSKRPCFPDCLTCFDNTSTSCLSCATSPPVGGVCLTLVCDTNCVTCAGLPTVCTSCSSGLHVLASSNTCGVCGAGDYVHPNDNKCYTCATNQVSDGSQCLNCHSSCATCSDSKDLGCLTCDLSQGLYLDPSTGFKSCTPCTSPSLQLSNGACILTGLISITISPRLNTGKRSSVDFSLILQIMNLPSNLNTSSEIKTIFEGVNKMLYFQEKNLGNVENYQARVSFAFFGTTGTLDYTFTAPLSSVKYDVLFSPVRRLRLLASQDGYYYNTDQYIFSYTNENYITSDMEKSEAQGEVVGFLAGNPLGSNPAFSEALMAAATLDPTGTLTRFTQVIKVTNRLYYININYGSRLDSFLKGIDKVSGIRRKTEGLAYLKGTKCFRGKLSYKKVSGDFYFESSRKIIVYFISWSTRNFFRFLSGRHVKVWALYIAYFIPRIHLMVFSVVFLDFVFYSVISAMHYRLIPSTLISYIALFMILIDLICMLSATNNKNVWFDFLRVRKSKFIYTPEDKASPRKQKGDKQTNGQKSNEKEVKLVLKLDKLMPLEPPSPMTPNSGMGLGSFEKIDYVELKKQGLLVVDFEKTWEIIDMNVHLMSFFSTPLKMDTKVYSSNISRNTVFFHFARMSMYQVLIPIGQYLPGLTIFILIILELTKIFLAIYIQIKYKALVNTLMTVTETFQHVFMVSFLCIALIICICFNGKAQIGTGWQMLATEIIIAAIVLEYVFLTLKMISFIKSYLKNRKLEKGKKKARFGWFIYLKPSEEYLNKRSADETRFKRVEGNSALKMNRISRNSSKIASFGNPINKIKKHIQPTLYGDIRQREGLSHVARNLPNTMGNKVSMKDPSRKNSIIRDVRMVPEVNERNFDSIGLKGDQSVMSNPIKKSMLNSNMSSNVIILKRIGFASKTYVNTTKLSGFLK